MKVIMRTPFGSKLYGTSTPESDTDWKGIYIPSAEDILLGNVKKSITSNTASDKVKNGADDVDEEYFSLQQFLEMAFKGETIALDMLHAPVDVVELDPEFGWIWTTIQNHRALFYTTNMKAYMGYVRRQAGKYGVKGTRVAALRQVRDVVLMLKDESEQTGKPKATRIRDYVFAMPVLDGFAEWCKDQAGNRFYEVLGRKYQDTMPIKELKTKLESVWEDYGARARQAERNEGIDWKALHHACRGGVQLLEIYRTGDLKYPLYDAPFLLSVKQGLEPFSVVQEYLEDLVAQVEHCAKLKEAQGMAATVDQKQWRDLILFVYRQTVINSSNFGVSK